MAKILVVDDIAPTRRLFAMRLQREGFDVVVAADGAEAVELAISELPSLILMDMGLPIKDGWTATREIRAHCATSEIPIIAFTNYDGEKNNRRCLEAGCTSVQPKSLPFQQLNELIKETLSGESA
ncbi:MAG: response regulator [Gammaproteobacteria bacterium]|nr:response regulator [Gammaproteobacteria bacterium]MDH3509102.1 response regulator [Gammaproteobacteria bacterium]